MSVTCPWGVRGPWVAQGVSAGCSWVEKLVPMGSAWYARGVSVGRPWVARGVPMCGLSHGMPMEIHQKDNFFITDGWHCLTLYGTFSRISIPLHGTPTSDP